MIIVLSGPQSQFKKAQAALKSAGCQIVVNDQGSPTPDDYGLGSGETRWTGSVYTQADIDAIAESTPGYGRPINVGDIVPHTGKIVSVEPKVPSCFLTVEGESPDSANDAVAELGWRLRSHWDKPEPEVKEPLTKTLARLGIDPTELKTLIGA